MTEARLPESPNPVWEPAPNPLVLDAGTAHVWRFAANWKPVEQLRALVSERELARADEMTAETARTQFVAAQAALRFVLARYIDTRPESIEFRFGEHWKPFLAHAYESDLQFNLSHSHHAGVVGVTRGREIGIDIEQVRARPNAARLAARFYAEHERAAFEAAGGTERAFLRLWTRKESHIKATGTGLSVSLRGIDTVAPDPKGWWYHEFTVGDDYVATLAAHGAPMTVKYLELSQLAT